MKARIAHGQAKSKRRIAQRLRNSKRRIARRLRKRQWQQRRRLFPDQNIHYDYAAKVRAGRFGGLGACLLLLCTTRGSYNRKAQKEMEKGP